MIKEAFRKRVCKIYEEVTEQNVEDDYEFMTEADMKSLVPPFSEILGGIENKPVSLPLASLLKIQALESPALPSPGQTF